MAAPTCAVAAANWRSARRISGRRRKSSAGRPTRACGGSAGIGASLASSTDNAPGCAPSSTSRRYSACFNALCRSNLRRRGAHRPFRLRLPYPRQAPHRTYFRARQGFPLRAQVSCATASRRESRADRYNFSPVAEQFRHRAPISPMRRHSPPPFDAASRRRRKFDLPPESKPVLNKSCSN